VHSLETAGQQLTLTEHLQVTFTSNFDYHLFPLDTQTLVAQMWSGVGTDLLEPVTVLMDPVLLPLQLFGFGEEEGVPTVLKVEIVKWGDRLGPSGVWGQSQMIQLTAYLHRRPDSAVVRILLPASICGILAYVAFFIKVDQLMARLALGVAALLGLSSCMRTLSEMLPPRSYLGIVEYWLYFLIVLVAIGCCHHSACSYISERRGGDSKNFDRTMRVIFPLAFACSFLWAYMVQVDVERDDMADVILIAGVVLGPLAILFAWLYTSLQYFSSSSDTGKMGAVAPATQRNEEHREDPKNVKDHYPGI